MSQNDNSVERVDAVRETIRELREASRQVDMYAAVPLETVRRAADQMSYLLEACRYVDRWLMEGWSEDEVERGAIRRSLNPAFTTAFRKVRAALRGELHPPSRAKAASATPDQRGSR